jgi:hypothetical protein
MKYLKSFENLKYNDISEQEFIKLFKENCKNFSLNNDPLYRGDMEEFTYGIHKPIGRDTKGITFVQFFQEKDLDIDKYPVIRKNSIIGIGGGVINMMKRNCGLLGGDGEVDGSVYRVIPFDDSKLVFCASMDLLVLNKIGKIETPKDEYFIMSEYTKDFKVPTNELKEIQYKLLGKDISKHGFEFFSSSSCLLLNVENEDFLKNL